MDKLTGVKPLTLRSLLTDSGLIAAGACLPSALRGQVLSLWAGRTRLSDTVPSAGEESLSLHRSEWSGLSGRCCQLPRWAAVGWRIKASIHTRFQLFHGQLCHGLSGKRRHFACHQAAP